ncbi:MMPL family transporter [Micrococcus aloeverae]
MPTPPDLSAFRTPAATGRPPRGLRLGLAAALTVVWLAVLGLGGPVFGKIGDVSSNDQATFLPASAESTRAGQEAAAFQDGEAVPAVVMGPASTADPAAAFPALADLAGRLGEVPGVTDVAGPIPSDDGAAVQFLAFVDSSVGAERPVADVVADLREVVADPAAADPALAGTVAAELGGAFAGIDGLLLLVALAVVFVILVAVYRSVLLPVLVLLTAVAALCGAIVAVYGMALAGWIQLNGQAQGILSILVIGAATDYCLLLVARHREELLVRADVGEALRAAVRGSVGAITASASTVALALLILMASDLNSTRSLGPVAATGVAFAWLAALTLLPALLRLTGRAAFWPTIPSPERARRRAERRAARGRAFTPPRDGAGRPVAGLEEDHGVWTRVGAVVARRPRLVWVATTVVLLALCGGLLQLRADGVAQEDVLLGDSDARQAQALLSEHFDAGAGAPAQILAPAGDAEAVLAAVTEDPGVAEAAVTTDTPEAAAGPPPGVTDAEGGTGAASAPEPQPRVVDGRVLVSATLADPGESLAAQQTVARLRDRLADLPTSGEILVGGPAAQALDTNVTTQRDLRVVIPLILAMLLVILAVLLRSLLAPVLLVAATVVSFGAALGVSALVFRHVFGFEDADPTVPLYGFVFLVALGIDYTIFLMTRAREETPRHGTRAGVLRALTVTGGVITSAGVVLAATFAALAVIPLMFMVQLAFIVAFGVLLDTLIVRSLLIPALVRDIGPKVWWPAKVD